MRTREELDLNDAPDVVFVAERIATLPAAVLEPADLPLIQRQDAPYHLAEISPLRGENGSSGAIFYVPDFAETDPDDFDCEAEKFGLSRRFQQMIKEAYLQNCRYVRFDSGAPPAQQAGAEHYVEEPALEKLNLDFSTWEIVFDSEFWRYVNHKDRMASVGFGTREKLAGYRDHMRKDRLAVILMSDRYEHLVKVFGEKDQFLSKGAQGGRTDEEV